jgi:uncharacterized protein (DUF2235 family)
MRKNIVIFSDGTGNRGGLLFDESRSNIYKLYRATRCGPDSWVDPSAQAAFYDAGLGTLPGGIDSIWSIMRSAYNLASQATGLGLTRNIVDCYAAIIRLYRPGDRIFLFGFSRGAYTVRCLGAVLALCGIPTRSPSNQPLAFDEKTTKKIAREAVAKIYQHATSRREDGAVKPEDRATPLQSILLKQRRELAERFRQNYGSDMNGQANVFPYFVGIFDTVASLANPKASMALMAGASLALVLLAGFLSLFGLSFMWSAFLLLGVAATFGLYEFLRTHIKWAFGLEGRCFWRLEGYPVWQLIHFTDLRMKFYDRSLNTNVEYARHAISIDENRASFQRESIDDPIQWPDRRRERGDWLIQKWFAGDHTDIGGSYPENESRLSDIALSWMAHEAETCGLLVDRRVLQLFPAADGMQHDECKSSVFKYFGKLARAPYHDSPMHDTVISRFEQHDVLLYDIRKPYRPECLRNNKFVAYFWDADDLIERFKEGALAEAIHRVAASQKGPYASHDAGHWQKVADEIARRKRTAGRTPL